VDPSDVSCYHPATRDRFFIHGRDAVKLPRLSIAKLMVVVGVVALNIAAARLLFDDNSEMLIGVALSGLILQVGLFQLMRSRGRGRGFWAGFIACGLMAMTTLVWAMLFPEVLGITATMTLVRMPGSSMYTVWYGYANFVSEHIIAPVLYDPRINPGIYLDSLLGGALIVGIRAVVWFLPQLLIAVVGGLLASLIGGRRSKSPAGDPRSLAASLLSAGYP